jgi:hypothetical protein
MRRFTILLTAGGAGLLVLALGLSDARSSGAADGIAPPLQQEAYQTRRLNTLAAWPWDISPDGRHVTIIDWGTGDLALMDLVSGEVSRVTDKGSWEESNEWSGGGKFSPDGRWIAHAYVIHGFSCPARRTGSARSFQPTGVRMERRSCLAFAAARIRPALPC